MNSVNRYIPDAAYRLRAADAAALTADAVLNAGPLVSPIGAPWNDAVKDGKVVFVAQGKEIAATGTYKLTVVTSANADLSAPQNHMSFDIDPAVATSKWVELLIDQVSLLKADTDAKYWGVAVDVGGTTPSIKIEAYILPPVGQ